MEKTENSAVYFASLTLENLKCFKGKHDINLSTPEGKPAMWTVILGNNNTGKTTILRALAGLEARLERKLKNKRELYTSKGFPTSFYQDECAINSMIVESKDFKTIEDYWGFETISQELKDGSLQIGSSSLSNDIQNLII
jgi:predicted ATPase